ncbi:hypothetical protein GGH12_005004 [Coemansia sp. RSA 1822]|nr:hypothetical protein GGH12_005004 [Coemansia sp. RSA 1822]
MDVEGRPVVYPCVEWLRIAVYSAVAFGSREYIPEADLFPRLRYLSIPGMYPFSSNVLLQDANNTLESLRLGINELEIGAILPALVDLEYSTSSFATTIGLSKSASSKIDNVTVNWRPPVNEINELGADTPEKMSAYAASLSSLARDYQLTGTACLINTALFDTQTVKAAILAIEDKAIEVKSVQERSSICQLCTQMTRTECRYIVVRTARFRRGLCGEKQVVVLVWMPDEAPVADRVEYKAHVSILCAQLRHVDCIVDVTDWSEFTRWRIMARVSELRRDKTDTKA